MPNIFENETVLIELMKMPRMYEELVKLSNIEFLLFRIWLIEINFSKDLIDDDDSKQLLFFKYFHSGWNVP